MKSVRLKSMFYKTDVMLAFALFIIGIMTRIPFACRIIYEGDGIRFALAMEHYDVSEMRPHAPGYILYVASAKLIDLFIMDARVSLTSVSVISGALMVVCLYFLGMKMYGKSNGIISALLLLTSPLFWFNNELPLTYALEGLLCTIFVLTCYKTIVKEKDCLLLSAVALGLAGGVRQHIVIILLPLWLYTMKNYSYRKILLAILVFAGVCVAWITPMIILTGGIQKYYAAVNAQFETWVLHPAPLLYQIKARGSILVSYMIYSLCLGILPMIYHAGSFFRLPDISDDPRTKVILLWLLPAILFFVFINIWNLGHVVFILPPLFIFMTEALKAVSYDFEKTFRRIGAGCSSVACSWLKRICSYNVMLPLSVLLLLLISSYVFLFYDSKISYAAIQREENRLINLVRMTNEYFAPEKTMILGLFQSTQTAYYLPNYLVYCPFPIIFDSSEVPIEKQNVYISYEHHTNPKTYWLPTDFELGPIDIPKTIDTIIVWEKKIAQYYKNVKRPLNEIESQLNNSRIYFLKVYPGEEIHYKYQEWTIR